MNGWILFIGCCLALVLTGLGVSYLGENPGYILIAHGDTSIELTLWTGIGLVILGAVLLYLVVLLIRAPFQGARRGADLYRGRKVKAQEKRATRGLVAYIEGNWEKARKTLSQLAAQKESPLMYNLLSARASHALGDDPAAAGYLRAAEEGTRGADLAVGLTQAEMQVDRGQLESAQATLIRVRAASSSHPAALKLQAQVYEGLKDWDHLRKLVPELRKSGVLDSGELLALERKIHGALLEQAALSKGNDSKAALDKAWKHLPRSLAHDSELAEVYVEKLVQCGESHKAERFLHHSLSSSWDEKLVAWYGKVQGGNVAGQLSAAESWLQKHGDSAALRLAAGRLALANRQWDKARGFFESSLQREDNPETCAELGRLLSHMGEKGKSIEYLQRGLELSGGELPKLPLPSPPAGVAVPPPALAASPAAS